MKSWTESAKGRYYHKCMESQEYRDKMNEQRRLRYQNNKEAERQKSLERYYSRKAQPLAETPA